MGATESRAARVTSDLPWFLSVSRSAIFSFFPFFEAFCPHFSGWCNTMLHLGQIVAPLFGPAAGSRYERKNP